jgi:hypothetical protein
VLQQRGREHVVLERRQVGERWRTERWESLRFQFPNWSLELPGYTIWRSQRASTACWTRLRSSLPGVRTGADPDRILTTLLFTDIVNSTTLAAQLGDRRWRDVLDQHSELGRGELARLGGREVVTTGTASSRPSTVRSRPCGVPLPWWRRCQQLGSRFAPVSIPGRSRYVGRIWEGWRSTSRLWFAALAGDGQVLVSSTVKDLLVGSGLGVDDRRECELKGVPGTWRLFAATPGGQSLW